MNSAESTPRAIPIAIETTLNLKKSHIIAKTAPAVNSKPSSLTHSLIAWNKMIETASLKRPSPRTIENSLGYSSNLRIVTAATISELHKIEQT